MSKREKRARKTRTSGNPAANNDPELITGWRAGLIFAAIGVVVIGDVTGIVLTDWHSVWHWVLVAIGVIIFGSSIFYMA